jgi:hypothetical protein
LPDVTTRTLAIAAPMCARRYRDSQEGRCLASPVKMKSQSQGYALDPLKAEALRIQYTLGWSNVLRLMAAVSMR